MSPLLFCDREKVVVVVYYKERVRKRERVRVCRSDEVMGRYTWLNRYRHMEGNETARDENEIMMVDCVNVTSRACSLTTKPKAIVYA